MPLPFNPRAYTRRISNVAYQSALDTGLITKSRKRVFEFVNTNAPCCQAEAVRALSTGNANDGVITTRFSELVDMEALEIVGKAPNPLNPSQTVAFYDITGRAEPLPKKRQFYMVWSENSGCVGYASDNREDLLPHLDKWIKRGWSDTKILPISVRFKR
jgi:hypothetical protein